MAINVNATLRTYSNYMGDHGKAQMNETKNASKTAERSGVKNESATSVGEKSLSSSAQKLLKDLRTSRADMDFLVADFKNGDNAKDVLAQSDKEFTVIFSKEEMEKMASDPKYYAEKMQSIQGALHMSEKIIAQCGFERAFGKNSKMADTVGTDMKLTRFGISFQSDGSSAFFAQLEKASASQKEYLEQLQEKKAVEKKETKKTTVWANSQEELLEKLKNIDWTAIKAEEQTVGGRVDYSI